MQEVRLSSKPGVVLYFKSKCCDLASWSEAISRKDVRRKDATKSCAAFLGAWPALDRGKESSSQSSFSLPSCFGSFFLHVHQFDLPSFRGLIGLATWDGRILILRFFRWRAWPWACWERWLSAGQVVSRQNGFTYFIGSKWGKILQGGCFQYKWKGGSSWNTFQVNQKLQF